MAKYGLYVSERQARLLSILIREHLGESVFSVRRRPELDRDLREVAEQFEAIGVTELARKDG